jgi:hypothetical protein
VIARGVNDARGPLTRILGLMGRAAVRPDEGLWFDRCWAVHTMFVRVPLDIVWLDKDLRVVELAINVRPWRMAVTCPRAYSVLELGSGATRDLLVGDKLSFEPQPLVREPFVLHTGGAEGESEPEIKLERYAS